MCGRLLAVFFIGGFIGLCLYWPLSALEAHLIARRTTLRPCPRGQESPMHDRNGKPVSVGDRVLVPCVITQTGSTPDYCNVTLETEEPMYPGTSKSVVILNARQVEKRGE